MHHFAGFRIDDATQALGVSAPTAKRAWTFDGAGRRLLARVSFDEQLE